MRLGADRVVTDTLIYAARTTGILGPHNAEEMRPQPALTSTSLWFSAWFSAWRQLQTDSLSMAAQQTAESLQNNPAINN